MLTIRPARSADLNEVWALVQKAIVRMREQGNPQWGADYPYLSHFSDAISAGDLFAACASDGAILGVLQINTWYEPCYDELTGWTQAPPALALHKMAVSPDAQRAGVGQALLEYAFSMARDLGLRSVRVDTYTLNTPMRGLSVKLGFHPVGQVFFPDRPLPYIVYEKTISPSSEVTVVKFRKAVEADIPAIAQIYDDIHAQEESGSACIGWSRGVYPTADTARAALVRDDLFVCEENGQVVGAAVINQLQVDVYEGAPWQHPAAGEEVMVLHTLVISPSRARAGYGRRFVDFYEDYARAHGCPFLRMDTNARNSRARALYAKLGYHEIAVVPCVFNGIEGVRLVLLEKCLSG